MDETTLALASINITETLTIAQENNTFIYPVFTGKPYDPNDYWELVLVRKLSLYVPPIIFGLGIIGNILSFIVFSTKSMRTSICSIFFRVLAVFDTAALIVGTCLGSWVIETFGFDVTNVSNFTCKVFSFLIYFVTHVSSWVLVFVSIERCIGILKPLQHKLICTKKRAYWAMGIMFFIIAAIDMYVPIIKGIEESRGNVCYVHPKHQAFYSLFWSWADFVIYSGGPFLIIFLCNVVIITRLLVAAYKRKHSLSGSASGPKLTSMTAMLITASFSFFILTSPITIYLFLVDLANQDMMTLKFILKMIVFHRFAMLASFLNHAINFFLYCFSGPVFRKNLLGLFPCYKAKQSKKTAMTGVTNMSSK